MENQQIGPFLVKEKLGSHRRHQVYHAIQTEQEREVALKFIKIPDQLPRESVLQKIQLESDILKELQHPNLVKFYGAGVEGEKIFLASKLVKGESLATLLGRRSRLTPEMVIDYAKQIASCLSYIHARKLVHSKLTPDKILIDRRAVVRLIDIRLNRARKRRWDAPRRHQLEIAAYMAPEVLTGKGATQQSDFYSLGVIMYEMLTGELPFEPDTLGRMIRKKKNESVPPIIQNSLNCPVWLEQIVMSLLEPNPKLRPDSAEEIVNALKEIKALARQKKSSFFQRVEKNSGKENAGKNDEANESRLSNWLASHQDSGNRTPFAALCLIMILALMFGGGFLATRPLSDQQLFSRAETLERSDKTSSMQQASELYERIMNRGAGEWATSAMAKHQALERKLLVRGAEDGATFSKSSTVRAFNRAFQAEREGEFENAIQRYRHLVSTTSPDGNEKHIHFESLLRKKNLEEKVAAIELLTFEIDEQIGNARKAVTENDLALARKILRNIIEEHEADADLRWIVERARSELRKLDS